MLKRGYFSISAPARPAPLPGVGCGIAWALASFLLTVPASAALYVTLDYAGGIPFGLAAVVIAVLFGSTPTLLLALLAPLVHNIFVLPPFSEFNPVTPQQLMFGAYCVLVALVVPPLMRHMVTLRRRAVRLALRFTSLFSAARSGSARAAGST